MRRLLLLILCICSIGAAQGQVAYDWRYWFDQSPTYEQGSSTGDLHLDVDVSGLSKSLHQINLQVRDAAGKFSEPVTRYFFIPEDDTSKECNKLHYWFDQDNEALQTIDIPNGMFDLDASSLSAGFHTLHLVATNNQGEASEAVHKGFIRVVETKTPLKWRYWFDNDTLNSVIMPSTTTSMMIDVNSLTDGIHYIHIQALKDNFSEPNTQMFIKVPNSVEENEMTCLILIDNELFSTEKIDTKNGGLATLNLDVKDFPVGIHKVDVMLKSLTGAMSSSYSSYFVKQPLGGNTNAIAYYSYWLNEADTERSVVKVDEPTNPYELIDMLPVEPQPLRSSSFHFEVADGLPTMYAKNDIHLTFTDMYGQESKPVSKQFVDVNTSEIVTDIAELQNTQIFARPEENKVKWFSFKAAPKDSVSLKSSQATSIQVFDAAGNELYAADGTASTKFDGCRIVEEGTYYVAVHDVTGTKSDVTLDAQFDRTLFALTYIADGDTLITESHEYCATIEPLSAPEKEGHTFSGWSEIPSTMPAHDVSVTGAFTVNQYKLSFVVDGDTLSSTMVDYGTELAVIDAPVREGETFSGWSTLPKTMPAKDVVITGTFSANSYKVTFKVDGEVYEETYVVYGTALTAIDAPTKTGYTFSGWSEIPSTMPAHDVSVTGTFTVNQYKLSFVVDGDTLSSTMVDYGTELAAIDAPVREGETFSGWSTLPKTMPAKDVVITGTFSANSYKVIFKVDGEVYEETYVVYGTMLTAIDAPTKTGYTFSGWSEMPETMPAEDVEVTGSFTVNQYKVTFIVDGDTLSSTMADYGTAISVPENPDKEGYTFSGWSPKLDDTVPAHDVSYEATFSINSYTITYMVGGEVVHIETVVFGEKIPEYIYNPEDERYTFTGWAGEIPETMPADNLTFVADILDSIAALKANDDTPVYNINGLKMGIASDLKRLPRGVYIVGGKTIIKK